MKMVCTACPTMLRARASAWGSGWGEEKHAHSVIFIQARKSKVSEPVSSAVAMNDPSRTRFDTCQASHKCEAQTAGLTAYLAERLAGYHVDDLRSRKDEKGGNVKH